MEANVPLKRRQHCPRPRNVNTQELAYINSHSKNLESVIKYKFELGDSYLPLAFECLRARTPLAVLPFLLFYIHNWNVDTQNSIHVLSPFPATLGLEMGAIFITQ
jgi:hypothetical protein